MKSPAFSVPSCRHCRYYTPEGRRGGHCQQLSASVQSSWKACSLAIPPFTPAWENLEEIMRWQEKTLAVQELNEPEPVELIPVELTPEEVLVEPSLALRHTVGIRALWM